MFDEFGFGQSGKDRHVRKVVDAGRPFAAPYGTHDRDDIAACRVNQCRSIKDSATGRDDVFDDDNLASAYFSALDGLAGTVLLGFLADEHGGQAAFQRHGSRDGYAAKLETRQNFG